MTIRKIIKIDESRCDGCGLCATACQEGAIQIIAGKARLVSEIYCDGLGACLGECPRGAITIEERQAETFDERKTHEHLARLKAATQLAVSETRGAASGCPGSRAQVLSPAARGEGSPGAGRSVPPATESEATPSALGNWPVQLHLVPPGAPYFQDADLLLVADCVPFACADFHRRFLTGKPVVIGCPKLDDAGFYVEKLTRILTDSTIKSLTVVHMEVPCCSGLTRIAQAALGMSGKNLPLADITIGIRGAMLGSKTISAPAGPAKGG
ncbi:MAG: 4Fe-4S binding protein [Pirellulales bacterium]